VSRKKILNALMTLLFAMSLTNHAVARQTEQVAFAGKLVDKLGQPIAGAKVAVYEMHFDGIAGSFMLHPVGKPATGEDGTFVFRTDAKPAKSLFYQSYIVAHKPGLALGWTIWKMREDEASTIELGEPEKLKGVIVDEAGKPVVGAQVYASLSRIKQTPEGKEKKEWLGGIAPLHELGTQTNNQGAFVFDNLPASLGVDLLVTASGKATTYTYRSDPARPAFKVGQTDIRVVLPEEARIEGRIVDPDTGRGIARTKFAVVATFSGLFYYRFVHSTDDDGTFKLGGLQTGQYLLRGDEIPHTRVSVKSGELTKITMQLNKPYYVRVLFEDGDPIAAQPEPWPGARTTVYFVEEGKSAETAVDIDDDGFLQVFLSREQYEKARLGKAWFDLTVPYTDERAYYGQKVFVYDLLTAEKTKAGKAEIIRPKGKPISLMGKALPQLDRIGLDAGDAHTEGKMVLICFFDMQQRPSRHCVVQLSKQAELLKEKGIAVAVVQGTDTDESKLNEWIKENSVFFPVGMIEGYEPKIRLNWGVQSMPWLILTDRRHVVTAEGFGLAELGNKLK